MTKTANKSVQIGVVAKSHLRKAAPHLIEIEQWLSARSVPAVFETATAALMPVSGARRVAEKAALVKDVDAVVVLGGDGTLLSMADAIGAAGVDVPLLGINFGSLGFLTEVTLDEVYPALEAVLGGTARLEHRMMLRASTTRAGAKMPSYIALNDVVVTKAASARMIDLSVFIGDEFLTRVKADGLIVATPTGSTAYNLAAGGPIVEPRLDALILTPIAPHMLTNRPIVIPASSPVRVQPNMDVRDELYATFDGQAGFQMKAGDEITIARAERTLQLMRPSRRSYFEVLRQKLKWNER
ncbi:MAG TPA: NAD(+)/NADH kinase [Vicinamibacterales bacterium]|nr:NAD(+)/NADH kinase [Vicinamibacterales bacterium]